ncbi:hypothetical protein scyTo_0022683, partial [Scyliorhinus torazame]|nr:hypothetical protein [Scyliorhinus torazame]
AIVRGSKIGIDGSLNWLLDEFENVSVTRSNSLRRGSPPSLLRQDPIQDGLHKNGMHEAHSKITYPAELDRHHDHKGRSERGKPESRDERDQGRDDRQRNRNVERDDSRAHPQQPRGQEPSRTGGSRPNHHNSRDPRPDHHRQPDSKTKTHDRPDGRRDHPSDREGNHVGFSEPANSQERNSRRERNESSDKRPKSTYTGETSPQSPRDKRPLSGPNIRPPNAPGADGTMKTTHQTGRPFNTYPMAETGANRGTSNQVCMAMAVC